MSETLTIAKCLEFAVRTEEVGAELYQILATKFASDPDLRELFEALGRDEVMHRDLFKALHARTGERFRDQKLTAEQQDYVRAMSIDDVFSPKGLAWSPESIKTRNDALARALELEKATLGYYLAMREIVGPDETIDALINVEKRHVVKVVQYMMTDAKFRGLADNY